MDDLRQIYHLEPPCGLMNDPNGLSFYDGKYRVFFQWNRFAKDHTHKEWGAFSSSDLAHWDFDGSAIVPDQPYDHSGAHSGCAIEADGQLLLFYTGSDKSAGIRRSHQCLASSDDCRTYVKEGVVIETPQGFTGHVRDPKVGRLADGRLRMLLGAQRTNGMAALISFASGDARTWAYEGVIGTSDTVEMCECPDHVTLDGQEVLLYCPQKRDNARDLGLESHACFQVVDEVAPGSAAVDLDLGTPVEPGSDFYAPQTFVAPDGRTILIAWMDRLTDDQGRVLSDACQTSGCLTVPRELGMCQGRLTQRPVRELELLHGSHVSLSSEADGEVVAKPSSRAYRLRIHGLEGVRALHIELNGSSERIDFDAAAGELSLTRTDWVTGCAQTVSRPVEGLRNLDVLSDETSVELFDNDGEAVVSLRVLPAGDSSDVRIVGITDLAQIEVVGMCRR